MAALSVEDVVRGTQGALVAGDLGGAGDRRQHRQPRAWPSARRSSRSRGRTATATSFLRDAAARGASCLVVHNLPDDLPPSVPTILVDDTTRALGRLGRLSPRALHGAGGGGHRLQRQDHHQGDDGRGPRRARPGAQAGGQLQQPVGPAAHPAAPAVPSTGRSRWSWGPTPRARSRRSPRSPAHGGRGHGGAARAHWRPSAPRRRGRGEERAGPRDPARRRGGAQRGRPARARDARPEPARGCSTTARARARTCARRVPRWTTATGCASPSPAGAAQRPVRLHFAGVTTSTNALAAAGDRRSRSGSRSSRSPAASRRRGRPRAAACGARAGRLRILDDTYNANPASVAAALETLGARRATGAGGWWCWATCSSWARSARPRIATWAGRSPRSGAAEFVGLGRWAQVAVEAARAGRARREPSRDHFEDAVALLLKRLAPGRRGAGQGLPGHAHGARGGRARGASLRDGVRMADALRAPRAARASTTPPSTSSGTSRSGPRWRRSPRW